MVLTIDVCNTDANINNTVLTIYVCNTDANINNTVLTIDVCNTDANNCAPNASCMSTGGASFTCTCNLGYTGTGFVCTGE